MVAPHILFVVPLIGLAKIASAKDCSTHTFTTCEDHIVHWYDPDDGQICDPLDCGGGRAPPKTNVPGCAGYTGTEVQSVSYLSCWKSFNTQVFSSMATTTKEMALNTATENTKATAETTVAVIETTAVAAASHPASTTAIAEILTTQVPSLATTPAATFSSQAQSAETNTLSSSSIPSTSHKFGPLLTAVVGFGLGALAWIY